MNRIEYEEFALKSVDPALGPAAPSSQKTDSPPLPVLYPASYHSSPIAHLRTFLADRIPKHRRGMYTWLLLSPLTFPLTIIRTSFNLALQ